MGDFDIILSEVRGQTDLKKISKDKEYLVTILDQIYIN